MSRHLQFLALMLTIVPVNAQAQSRWDVAGMAGVFGARSPETPMQPYQEERFETATGGIVVGRYLTSNLKFEIEATGTGAGTQYVQREVVVPGYPGVYFSSAEARTSIKSLAATVAWQFFDNEWIHPFVQAGVSADFERHTVHTWPQRQFTGDPSRGGAAIDIPGGTDGPDYTQTLRAVFGGGAKVYVSPRLFLRADGRASFGEARQQIAFRIGFGGDF